MGIDRFERFFLCHLLNFRVLLLLVLILCLITAASAASTSATASAATFTRLVLLCVNHLVLISEVVFEIDSFFVLKSLTLFFYDFFAMMSVFIFVVSHSEAQ